MNRCKQELCPNWSGDGNVCPCAIFDLDEILADSDISDPPLDEWGERDD